MALYDKIKWILGILLVFFLILTTNLIDRQNFRIVTNSIETIYADRLIAKNLIYDLSGYLHEKEVRFIRQNQQSFDGENDIINEQCRALIEAFSKTKLVPEEEIVFIQFRRAFEELAQYEGRASDAAPNGEPYFNQLSRLSDLLDELSNIQIMEGRRELKESRRALKAVDLFTNLEIYMLVFMAIIVQILVMYRSPTSSAE
ncbi:MCP four helix bundle domain-containing protein [Lewinella sp. W8]|uniref:MCP four helix bundle domain-containing protein n=1 Tax=Lewinella sp. W8 TaxID=2528208 RepID=UPI001067A90C|nr:MCP four helix bundle domain-containing protein [Lewinella sp. W8]MTB52008.1 chemotaxis protein [Lewinella sp. W8]